MFTFSFKKQKRMLKISDREVDQIREHFGQMENPPTAHLAAVFKVSYVYMDDILNRYRRQDTSLRRKVDRRKGLRKNRNPHK